MLKFFLNNFSLLFKTMLSGKWTVINYKTKKHRKFTATATISVKGIVKKALLIFFVKLCVSKIKITQSNKQFLKFFFEYDDFI